jgi:hypothetical protein
MLPRGHGNQPLGFPNDTVDVNAESLRWFDHFAKGIANGAGPGVIYYSINARHGSEWREQSVWSGAEPRETYYLQGGSLTLNRPGRTAPPVSYAARQVAWFDGAYAEMHRKWDGNMAAADANSLVHTSAPVARDTELTGTPVAHLWISADQPDVNVFAVVEDVSPDGTSRYVTDGRIRASWRKLVAAPWGGSAWHWHRGFAADIRPLTPGKPEELVFDLFPTSYVIKSGHRLRFSIATSLGAAHQAPPLVGGRAATLALWRDRAHPSAIELPVVPDRR